MTVKIMKRKGDEWWSKDEKLNRGESAWYAKQQQ